MSSADLVSIAPTMWTPVLRSIPIASIAALVRVRPLSTTNITLPAISASNSESASPSSGGASMITMSKCEVTSATIAWKRPVESRSAGLGGNGPLGRSHRFSNWVGNTCLRTSSSAVSSRVNPTLSLLALNAGLRMSASISSTDWPRRAKFCASASDDEDLPSPDRVLVTTSALGRPSSVLNRSAATTAL